MGDGEAGVPVTGLGVSGFLSFVTNQPLTTAEAIGGLYGGAVGGRLGTQVIQAVHFLTSKCPRAWRKHALTMR